MRILIVVGNDELREHLLEYLEGEGCQVSGVKSASSALAGLEQDPLPDILLVDHFSSGRERDRLAHLVRASPRLKTSRLVLITNEAEEPSPALPADAVLKKPFDLGELDAVLGLLGT